MNPERVPAMPEDLVDRLARADVAATQEIDGARVAAVAGFAAGLDGLVKHLRAVDARGPVDRLRPSMWRSPMDHAPAVSDRMYGVRFDLDLALNRFRLGDKALTADFLAAALLDLIFVASDLDLNIGDVLGRVVPAAPTRATTVVADQSAS